MATTVVDIHKVNGVRPYFDVYMGRRTQYTEFTKDSIWKNPYSMKKYGEESLVLFEKYLRSNKELLKRLPELKDKVLGCWCKNQSWYSKGKCHVDIIIKVMKELGIIDDS